MNVKELKAALADLPDDATVFVQGFWDDFYCSPMQSVEIGTHQKVTNKGGSVLIWGDFEYVGEIEPMGVAVKLYGER